MTTGLLDPALVETGVEDYDPLLALLFLDDDEESSHHYYMKSEHGTPYPSRAKIKKIVQDEFTSTIRGELKVTAEDLKATFKAEKDAAIAEIIGKVKFIAKVI